MEFKLPSTTLAQLASPKKKFKFDNDIELSDNINDLDDLINNILETESRDGYIFVAKKVNQLVGFKRYDCNYTGGNELEEEMPRVMASIPVKIVIGDQTSHVLELFNAGIIVAEIKRRTGLTGFIIRKMIANATGNTTI